MIDDGRTPRVTRAVETDWDRFRVLRLAALDDTPDAFGSLLAHEKLKERHEAGQLHSIAFLKELLDIARDVLLAEKDTPPEEDEDRGKAALTELFQEVEGEDTPVVVRRVVDDIDSIVRVVRFPGWQQTSAGERLVKKALRGTLFKYKLHSDKELFEKAYGYIVQYY